MFSTSWKNAKEHLKRQDPIIPINPFDNIQQFWIT